MYITLVTIPSQTKALCDQGSQQSYVTRRVKDLLKLKGVSKEKISIMGCSYEGELARLGGLARLGEISPSLRNSYKNIDLFT